MAANSGEIADGKDDVDVAVLAKDEITDSSDRLVLVVDHRLYFQPLGTIASRHLLGLHRCKRDFLPLGMMDPQREHDGRQDDRGQERELGPVHETSRDPSAHYTSLASPRSI